MKKKLNKKVVKKKRTSQEEREFERYIQEIEKPDYDGPDISWSLPANATPLEKAKYNICERILAYQQDNDLSTKEIAKRIHLTTAETKDILHYHLSYFTFERLITYANRLLYPSQQVEIVIKEKKNNIRVRAY